MAVVDDLDEVLEQFKLAGNEFMKGNPKPVQELFSHRDDVTLANPFGPPARGWEQVAKTQERGASYPRAWRIVLSRWRDLRLRDRGQVRDTRASLHLVDRADQREGRRSRGGHPVRSAGHYDPATRGWRVEGRASARGSHNHAPTSRVGDPRVAFLLERTS